MSNASFLGNLLGLNNGGFHSGDNYAGKNNNPGPRKQRKKERQRRDLNYRKRRERGLPRK